MTTDTTTTAIDALIARLNAQWRPWDSITGRHGSLELINPDGPAAASMLTLLLERVAELELENKHLKKVSVSRILPDLLTAEETEALVGFLSFDQSKVPDHLNGLVEAADRLEAKGFHAAAADIRKDIP